MSTLEANVEILLIENKELQDSSRSLSQQLASVNKKYNSLLSVLQTQYSFMNDIELRMNMIMKRNKPLKDDLKRIRLERNELKEQNGILSKETDLLKTANERLEKENLWLLEQIELSRRVGKDMESILSTRMNIQTLNEKSDIEEKMMSFQRENTRLEVENQGHLAKIQRLEHEINRMAIVVRESKEQVLREQAKLEFVKNENNQVKQQMIQLISSVQKENEVPLHQVIDKKEKVQREEPLSEKNATINQNLSESDRQREQKTNLYAFKQKVVFEENVDVSRRNNQDQTPNPQSFGNLNGTAKKIIEAKRTLQNRKRSPLPSNPFFPYRKMDESSFEPIAEVALSPSITSSPDRSTFLEQPTFLIQEALESKKAMESLDSKIKNLEDMF